MGIIFHSFFNALTGALLDTISINLFGGFMKRLIALLGTFLISNSALAEWGVNLREGVTSISSDIYDLHMLIFWICVVIAVVVFGVMIYSLFQHRKSKGAKAANFHDNTTIELVWTVIPILILVGMAIPATSVMIDLENTENAEMNVKITGHQWKWQYEYPDHGNINFISNLAESSKNAVYDETSKPENYLLEVDKPLVLPADTRIRFLFTSADVIHNWWVPDFGVKQDANPGFINDAWAEIPASAIGRYRGQCAELCGKDHGFMPIVVDVVSKEDFKTWVADQKAARAAAEASANKTWTKDELMANGKKVYDTNCAGCHGVNGVASVPVFPNMKGSALANGPAADHTNIVLHGKGGMPAFKMLGDADLASVITYERNAFGNTGSVVQPSDVKSAR